MNDTNNVVSVEEVLAYLGIDYADDMVNTNITRAIKTADAYLKGSIDENYPVDNPKVKELTLLLVADLYNERGLTSTVSNNMRRLVEDLSLQLRLELRRGLHDQSVR